MSATPEPEDPHWFRSLARFLGPAYLRDAFTKGTEQEVAFLVDAPGLEAGERVLDVGCGPGRHALGAGPIFRREPLEDLSKLADLTHERQDEVLRRVELLPVSLTNELANAYLKQA